MNKIVLFICLSLFFVNSASAAKYPKLFLVEEDEEYFLADENGVLRYSMSPPHVTIDTDSKIASIYPTAYYAPGTTYYGETYDNFYVLCSYGSPRYSVETLRRWFGPSAGKFILPITKEGYSGVCSVWSYVKDLEGTTFQSEQYILYYSRTH